MGVYIFESTHTCIYCSDNRIRDPKVTWVRDRKHRTIEVNSKTKEYKDSRPKYHLKMLMVFGLRSNIRGGSKHICISRILLPTTPSPQLAQEHEIQGQNLFLQESS